MDDNTHFRGWAKPGVKPDALPLGPEDGESLDALCGWFRIFQLKKGHRFSTDDLLTAWYGTSWCPSARRVLDLGSGIGTVAMVAAWRLPGAQIVTVEAQQQSVGLAKKSIQQNGLQERFDVRRGDFRDSAVLGDAAPFDLILGSPPYFPLESGVKGDHPQKIACRFEVRGNIDDYCAVAARHLTFGATFAFVFPINPPFQMERVQAAAAAAELVIVRHRPVVLRDGDAPLLGLFLAMRATDLPEGFRRQSWQEPPLVIRQKDGHTHPEYAAVKLSFGFPP